MINDEEIWIEKDPDDKSNENEATKKPGYFQPHCDDPGCDLGMFEYNCPNCGKGNRDSKVWWVQSAVYFKGKSVVTKCGHCEQRVLVQSDGDDEECDADCWVTPLCYARP